MSDDGDDFSRMWQWFATHCEGYSPLYARISRAVAGDRALLDLVRSAPPDAHLPPALLAAVHYVLLEDAVHPLSEVYAGESDADPGPLFLDVCRTHQSKVMHLLATRHIQTNDCGRSALIGPGLSWLRDEFGEPMALVDVGASAGLNLLCDRYRIDYGASGASGPADSPVVIQCEVKGGEPPIAPVLPGLVDRIGIDRSPIDLSNPDDARWLLACVWPDTGRLDRTAASIGLARDDPPHVRAGDADDLLPGVLRDLPDGALAVVVTTWAFAYFSLDARTRFTDILESESTRRRVAWLSAESAGTVESFSGHPAAGQEHATSDILGAIMFDGGSRRQVLLAFVHEHGHWLHWQA